MSVAVTNDGNPSGQAAVKFEPPPPLVLSYLEALGKAQFAGDLATDRASRMAIATDNSIYQLVPPAVLFPKNGDDLSRIVTVANRSEFKDLTFCARGGGTSMHGQTLGWHIVVDTSRYMRRILAFDPDRRLVKVEPGLVRDELLDFLRPHGLFFAPNVSTSSRATIGGMVSNDSSGKGSVIYGKTSRHIEAMEIILSNGRELEIRADVPADSNDVFAREISAIIAPHHDEMDRVFPDLVRQFTGYNLQGTRERDGTLHPVMLIAGAEGTLCLIKSITCRASPLPAHTGLVAVRYPTHDAGLRAIPSILELEPSAIEFIDGTILAMAAKSPFADRIAGALGVKPDDAGAGAVHFVEFIGDTRDELEHRLDRFLSLLETARGQPDAATGWQVARNETQIAGIWDMRKDFQSLSTPRKGRRQAVAFIEDCVVPPQYLADFVAELEALLRARGIEAGMYGHADVGCVHIRPALDLSTEVHRRQIREIEEEVFALTQKHHGLLWGEHGKGLRSEFAEKMLGPRLCRVMGEIKQLFDPENRLNPGKIATPAASSDRIIRLDEVPMRGQFDQQIVPDLARDFDKALRCNGNGACFNQNRTTALCPSYKASNDRRYSPKGRAEVLREWMRLRSARQVDQNELLALSDELFDTMQNCLACKSCAGGGCLFRVDIPAMRSRFLQWYYEHHRRPAGDYAVLLLERMAPILARFPHLVNAIQTLPPLRALLRHIAGLVDVPGFSTKRLSTGLKQLGVRQLKARDILSLSTLSRQNLVIVVQDCFTSFYDADVVLAHVALLRELGYKPVVLAYHEGGKPLHVQGFLRRFERIARKNAATLSALGASGLPLVGVDPATTLMYRHEYDEVNREFPPYRIQLLSEWLTAIELPRLVSPLRYKLLQHCTESSLHPETGEQWKKIFDDAGLTVDLVKTGCCGMSGLFGHQQCNQDMARRLYDLSWREVVEQAAKDPGQQLMVTGFSCRSQIRRYSGLNALHPAQVLLETLRQAGSPVINVR